LEKQVKELRAKESTAKEDAIRIDELSSRLEKAESLNTKLLSDMAALEAEKKKTESSLDSLGHQVEQLNNQLRSTEETRDIEDELKQEMADMETSIKEAAKKIEELALNSKKKDTGVKLEVNEKILESCTGLMAAIMQLIKDSKALQEEIISQGKTGLSNGVYAAAAKEFYQRNHRWTEGLISAAKVVALAAKTLVDASDKVVTGKARFSELMVASNEIAAATAQLVVASRVKAERQSTKLSALSCSSKKVSECTGNIVATAKICAEKLENNISKLDLSKLSLTQAKKLEFETQAKVIELSAQLDKEHERLSSLRKQHYHLASES